MTLIIMATILQYDQAFPCILIFLFIFICNCNSSFVNSFPPPDADNDDDDDDDWYPPWILLPSYPILFAFILAVLILSNSSISSYLYFYLHLFVHLHLSFSLSYLSLLLLIPATITILSTSIYIIYTISITHLFYFYLCWQSSQHCFWFVLIVCLFDLNLLLSPSSLISTIIIINTYIVYHMIDNPLTCSRFPFNKSNVHHSSISTISSINQQYHLNKSSTLHIST